MSLGASILYCLHQIRTPRSNLPMWAVLHWAPFGDVCKTIVNDAEELLSELVSVPTVTFTDATCCRSLLKILILIPGAPSPQNVVLFAPTSDGISLYTFANLHHNTRSAVYTERCCRPAKPPDRDSLRSFFCFLVIACLESYKIDAKTCIHGNPKGPNSTGVALVRLFCC